MLRGAAGGTVGAQHPLGLLRVQPPVRVPLQQAPYDGQQRLGLRGRPYLVDHDRVQDAAERVAPKR